MFYDYMIYIVFDFMMAVIMFLFGMWFYKSEGKAANFLSGYNMKSADERKKYDENAIESIEKYGIMNPLIVMPTTEGFYRIISGHRRKYCAEKLGYTKVPAIIRYMKEDDSIISMVNSNLHKEKIRSRFGYSSTMDTRFCFVYQLSQKMMI